MLINETFLNLCILIKQSNKKINIMKELTFAQMGFYETIKQYDGQIITTELLCSELSMSFPTLVRYITTLVLHNKIEVHGYVGKRGDYKLVVVK